MVKRSEHIRESENYDHCDRRSRNRQNPSAEALVIGYGIYGRRLFFRILLLMIAVRQMTGMPFSSMIPLHAAFIDSLGITVVRNAGGAPANVAIAMARNGLKTGMCCSVGEDDFGRFLIKTLEENQVRCLKKELCENAITTMAFVSLAENGERSFTFARKPGGPLPLPYPLPPRKSLKYPQGEADPSRFFHMLPGHPST